MVMWEATQKDGLQNQLMCRARRYEGMKIMWYITCA